MTDAFDRLKSALADRYAIERELGAGGMATVYVAQDLKHERQVAVKVLRPELAVSIGADRFLREIKIAANLNHPHILPLHDSGEAEGFLFYVMPYVEGESLKDRLNREKQLPIDDALRITAEVADALGFAHHHNVVHRDIKPENILLEANHAVVADFGVARAIEEAEETRLTETGIAVGTPAYLSPEQASGERELDGRTDIYALGCVLYEMLAGQPPFSGPTVENIIHQHLAVEPQSVTKLRPAVPGEIETAVSKALAKAPADRFTSAAAFGDALLSAPADATPEPHNVVRWWWPWSAGVAALAALVLTGWMTGFLGDRGGTMDGPRAPTIVAKVEGNADVGVRAAVRELVRTELDQSGILVTLGPDEIRRGLQLAGRPDTTTIGPELAHELAVRGSIRTVVVPRLDRLGERYTLTVRVLDAEGGEPLATKADEADSDDALIAAVEEVVRGIRSDLGERLSAIQRDRPLRQVATPSLDAYRLYVESMAVFEQGDWAGTALLLRRVLELDPDFTSAWINLGLVHSWEAKPDSARLDFLEAQRRESRLTDTQRQLIDAQLAALDGDWPGVVRARQLMLARNPRGVGTLNMLSDAYERMGRWEEALQAMDSARSRSASPMSRRASWPVG